MASYIPHVTSADGRKLSLPKKDEALAFGECYSSLYNLSTTPLSPSSIADYLSSARLCRLAFLLRRDLEAPIMMAELQAAVSAIKLGKSSGPDGFIIQYFKTLLPLLGAHMTKTFNALGQSSSFHPVTLLAHISVIPKEGRDSSSCSSYQPISLLNVDQKLFTKLLASCLQSHLPKLVHLD